MKNMKKIYMKENLLYILFKDLYSHIGWSDFYKKYILVEPIWYIKKEGNTITDFICLDELIYNFKDSFGKIIAENIDEEASEFIEQAFIKENNLFFICDNPILFPNDRLKDFSKYLQVHKNELSGIDGIIHYHINEKELNEEDINVLSKFFTNILKIDNKNNYLGMVISQKKMTENNSILENKNNYIIYMINEFKNNNISLSAKLFYINGSMEDCIISMQ